MIERESVRERERESSNRAVHAYKELIQASGAQGLNELRFVASLSSAPRCSSRPCVCRTRSWTVDLLRRAVGAVLWGRWFDRHQMVSVWSARLVSRDGIIRIGGKLDFVKLVGSVRDEQIRRSNVEVSSGSY